ncbi:diiron oxygenase [Salinarimonas chemoclinalis]|uniref:diiron oxygenase n=1 Tax=Salinarimonas chemoclinalis TaxID=3241599 RepID=UPI0035590291
MTVATAPAAASATPHLPDPKHVERLLHLSRKNNYDAYSRFAWPAPDAIARDVLWCDEDLLTTWGTELHERLPRETLVALSHWECVNFFSLNVHGIKDALSFVMQAIYQDRYAPWSEYLHFFIAEENAHMWFFAKFCLDYTGTIYPTPAIPAGKIEDPLERDLYMFASTLVFEEFVDFYNHKVSRNDAVPAILKEINHVHHVDESRHISFGRGVVAQLHAEILARDASGEAKARVSRTVQKIFLHFIGQMYNPRAYDDAGVTRVTGLSAAAVRNRLRNDPARVAYHQQWFKRTADWFVRQGLLANADFLDR